ncbi:MAG: hypothetical protein WCE21_01920 [Candidatus Babeliales bacterium]
MKLTMNIIIGYMLLGMLCVCFEGHATNTFWVFNYINNSVTPYFHKQATTLTQSVVMGNPPGGMGLVAGRDRMDLHRVEMKPFPLNTIDHLKIESDMGTLFDGGVNFPVPGKEIFILYKRPHLAEFALRLQNCGDLLSSNPEVKQLVDQAQAALTETRIEFR